MMEWVETTGRTIEEAKEAALDELGVDAQDAEFEVLEEPKLGLFGRLRTEGRVRARVRPSTPRAKEDRRDRRRRNRPTPTVSEEPSTNPAPRSERSESTSGTERTTASSPADEPSPRSRASDQDSAGPGSEQASTKPTHRRNTYQGESLMDVALDQQAEVASHFLTDLLACFGLTVRPTIAIAEEEDRVEIHLDGDNLGILIGPKGATLLAIQDLTRTFVQHRTGARNGRLHLDIARYREKRSKALAAFADKVAREVLTTGRTVALEPMSSPDRKVVHDTVAQISGVESRSEGEDDRRHVVLSRQENPTTPADAVVKPDSGT